MHPSDMGAGPQNASVIWAQTANAVSHCAVIIGAIPSVERDRLVMLDPQLNLAVQNKKQLFPIVLVQLVLIQRPTRAD